jgi:hypothetical protein
VSAPPTRRAARRKPATAGESKNVRVSPAPSTPSEALEETACVSSSANSSTRASASSASALAISIRMPVPTAFAPSTETRAENGGGAASSAGTGSASSADVSTAGDADVPISASDPQAVPRRQVASSPPPHRRRACADDPAAPMFSALVMVTPVNNQRAPAPTNRSTHRGSVGDHGQWPGTRAIGFLPLRIGTEGRGAGVVDAARSQARTTPAAPLPRETTPIARRQLRGTGVSSASGSAPYGTNANGWRRPRE